MRLFTLIAIFMFMGQPYAAQAQGFSFTQNNSKDFINTLNENNIRDFLEEVREISTGQRPDMLDDDVANYFDNHMADSGKFESTMRYDIPGYPTQEITMKLDKKKYINSVVNGRHMMEDYNTSVEIRTLDITRGGKQAKLVTVTKEKGRMPVPQKDGQEEIVPVTGESKCEQILIVSTNNFIQMKSADCATVIKFDPFGGKPLGEEMFTR